MENKLIKNKIITTVSITLLCVALGIVLAIVYKAVKQEKQLTAESEKSKTIETLQAEVIDKTNRIAKLEIDNENLSKQLEVYENSTEEELLAALTEKNEKLMRMAGLSAISGKGVEITFTYHEPSDIKLSQYYLTQLINELKAAEAQAIAFSGNRLVAMSEVKAISDCIVVNGENCYGVAYSGGGFEPTFVISVIGDPDKIASALNLTNSYSDFENFLTTSGGAISMEKLDNITIPGISEEKAEKLTNELQHE